MPYVEPGADYVVLIGFGSASLSLHGREASDADRKVWAWEDAARDARRIPIGFRASAYQAAGPRKPRPKRPKKKS